MDAPSVAQVAFTIRLSSNVVPSIGSNVGVATLFVATAFVISYVDIRMVLELELGTATNTISFIL